MKTITRSRLLGTTLLFGSALISAPAYAQSEPPQTTAPATTSTVINTTAEEASEPVGTDIVVTGSLIRNPNLISSSPVSVIGSDEVQLRGSQTAEQLLRNLPGGVPSIGSAVNNGQGGSSNVDLRGLGSNRNLVLLDGDRIVPGDPDGTTDLNNIPLALISRLDVLTGGASTTYGADAVSGVVNFVTKRDFSGIDLSASEQLTGDADGNYFRTDLVIGANFDDGRGNAVLSVGYQEADAIYQGARDYSLFAVNSVTGVAAGASPTSTPTAIGFSDPAGSFLQVNPTGTALVNQYQGFNFNPYNIFQTPFKRYNIYGQAHYEASDSIELYARGLFSKNTVSTIIAPSGLFGNSLTVPSNNPYLNDTIRQQICALQEVPVPVASCTAAAGLTLELPAVYRRLTELGPRIGEYTSTVFDYRAGARINVTSSIKLDVSGAYGESDKVLTNSGYTLNDRFQQALNASSTTECADTSNGCVPLNIFGPAGSITADQVAFIGAQSTVQIKSQLSQAKAVLSGDVGFSSPYASQPIGFAVGGEYRSYGFQQVPDVYAEEGNLGGSGGPTVRYSGSYNVKEAFGELIVPLVSDRSFFQELTVEGGIRYSSYDIKAPGNPSFNTTTFKGGGTWSPVEGLKIRGNYQRAVRAPNISELFLPVSTQLTNLTTDLCAGPGVTTDANLAAICLAQGAPAGRVTNGTIPQPAAGQANYTSGGNPNIRPEKADTFTVGVIIEPKAYIPGLTISVDYYNIKINGAITSPTPDDVIGACFDNITAASATSAECARIVRNPATGALSGPSQTTPGLLTTLTNSGRLATDGIDLLANYRRDLGFVGLDLAFNGNWTHSSKFRANPGSTNRECVGKFSADCSSTSGSIQPEFYWNQRTTFTFDSVDLSVLWRHIGAVESESGTLYKGVIKGTGPLVGKTVDFNKIDAYNYIDLAVRIRATDNFEFTITANNIFDKDPPIVGAQAGSTAYNSGNTYPSTYDALGRVFNVGARVKF